MPSTPPPAHPDAPPWPGFSTRATLVLPLPPHWLGALPARVDVDGLVLRRKREAHLTLLDRAATALVRSRCDGSAVRAAFQAQAWDVSDTGERWLLRKPLAAGRVAHSIIAIARAPGLAAFRHALARRCGVDLPEVPAHVTLYVAGRPAGIGLPDFEAFERLRLRRLDAVRGDQSP